MMIILIVPIGSCYANNKINTITTSAHRKKEEEEEEGGDVCAGAANGDAGGPQLPQELSLPFEKFFGL